MSIRILLVFGTRPEAIKMAPLVKAFLSDQQYFTTRVCVTAQHRQMLDQILDFFSIRPDYDLNLMKPGQNLNQLTSDVILGMKSVLKDFLPDYVFVHGDTTTSTIAALAAFYEGSKICHVEAGLRTYNKYSPFPEEVNRQLTSRLADIHFAPTETSKNNLLSEGIQNDKIQVVGNTVLDALLLAKGKLAGYKDPEIERLETILDPSKNIVLVTGHRRENFGQGFINICIALKALDKRKDIEIVYPVHLNPSVQEPVYQMLSDCQNIKLIKPLAYPAFIWLMNKSHILLTDSGGIQEEAPTLGKPVLVMRDTTERPEAITAGTVKLVGVDPDYIYESISHLLDNKDEYEKMSSKRNPYGDGDSAKRIVNYFYDIRDI